MPRNKHKEKQRPEKNAKMTQRNQATKECEGNKKKGKSQSTKTPIGVNGKTKTSKYKDSEAVKRDG